MGQYRVSVNFRRQIGVLLDFEPGCSFVISLPLLNIVIGLTESAQGVSVFGKTLS